MLTGLLYAMKGEIESLLPPDAVPERTEAGVLFYRLRPDLVACCGGVGKVNAAMSAQLLISRYQPDVVGSEERRVGTASRSRWTPCH